MKIDLCLNPRVFTKGEVLAKLPQLRQALKAQRVELAYLFGSVTRGQADSLSDVDIAVLPDPKRYRWLETYGEIYHELCLVLGADNVDLVLLNEAPLTLRFRAVRDGVLIYDTSERRRRTFEDHTAKLYLDSKPLQEENWKELMRRLKKGVTKAVRKVDKGRIEALFSKMEESLLRLRELCRIEEKEFLSERNWQARSLVEHHLRIAIEAALDVGRHIIAAKGLGTPEEYREIIKIMGEKGIIPADLADGFAAYAGLRNVLVHLYWKIDYRRLHEIITRELSLFDQYAQRIAEYLSEEA